MALRFAGEKTLPHDKLRIMKPAGMALLHYFEKSLSCKGRRHASCSTWGRNTRPVRDAQRVFGSHLFAHAPGLPVGNATSPSHGLCIQGAKANDTLHVRDVTERLKRMHILVNWKYISSAKAAAVTKADVLQPETFALFCPIDHLDGVAHMMPETENSKSLACC